MVALDIYTDKTDKDDIGLIEVRAVQERLESIPEDPNESRFVTTVSALSSRSLLEV